MMFRDPAPGLAPGLLILALTTGFVGCSSDNDTAGDDDQVADGPLYAINARTFSADFSNQISYLLTVDDLDAGEASLDDAIELPGAGSLWARPESGEAFFVSVENLTVSKYAVTGSGRLERQDNEIGLLGAGIASLLGEAIAFDGSDRGFLFDLNSAQVVALDLDDMSIVSTYDLSSLLIESAALTYLGDGGFKRRGDEFIGVAYGSNSLFDEVDPNSKLGFFDPSDGSLEVIDAPCGGLQYSFESENGDWYFSTDPWVAGLHALDDSRSPAPCLARLASGARAFDEATIALNDLTGGITGGIVPGPDNTAFVRVLDEGVFPLQDDTGFLEPFSAPAWTTWRVDLSDPDSVARLERAHIAGGIKFAEVDGNVYQNESVADFSSTTLVRTTGSGDLSEALIVPGIPWNVVRVR